MVYMINELSGNTYRFARYCAEQCSIADLVAYVRNGIDHDMCEQWDVSGEQWQDAILAALEELRCKY